ncbi:MAG: hypothetical protein AB7J35_13290 [Dehalococcoidia bacterium]
MTDPGPVPLLFGFRGIRFLQVVVATAAGALAISGVLVLNLYLDEKQPLMLLMAIFFGMLFLWLFGMALRLPTSFVAISPDRMRIRFGGFVDTIVETNDVLGARLVPWNWWRGLGVRTAFGGDVALVAAWGTAAEITLKRPIRVWLLPRLWRVSATRVVVSVRNPQKLADRFGPVKNEPAKKKGRRK